MMKDWHWKIREEFQNKLDIPLLLTGGTVIKSNRFRSVRRVTMPDGGVYYVKHDTPCTKKRIIQEFFQSKSQSEYNSAALLHSYGIPGAGFVALGKKFPESILVSPELKGCIPASQFRYVAPVTDTFLYALCDILHRTLKHRITHPDLHAGNLMVKLSEPTEMFLIDLYGVRRTPFHKPVEENCYVLTEFLPFIKPGQGPELLRYCGADPGKWDFLVQLREKEISRTWGKRRQQILSGNSKFVETRVIDGATYVVRKTPWYESVPFDPAACEPVTLNDDMATAMWLSQFHDELLLKPISNRVAAIRRDGIHTVLYYTKNKEYSII